LLGTGPVRRRIASGACGVRSAMRMAAVLE
jgi:hypothetical protein